MKRVPTTRRAGILGLAVAAALLWPGGAGRADDSVLFSTTAAPNVILLADNSGSMEHIVWHPAFDPSDSTSWGCNHFSAPYGTQTVDDNDDGDYDGGVDRTYCGNTRKLYTDPLQEANGEDTRWDERYLNWYFGLDSSVPAEAAILAELAAQNNGTLSTCLGGGTFSKYRRARSAALQQILREVICQVNAAGKVRFGIAQFRDEGDPEGGFVVVPVDDYSSSQDAALQSAINNIVPETWTPLAETLFQVYTYFMSRNTSDLPLGKDGSTAFPDYGYTTSTSGEGGPPGTPPADPVQYHCQKNFVIVITDGEPTRDDFDSGDTNPGVQVGFADFKSKLIGDYASGDSAPGTSAGGEEGGSCTECSYYLDDIAHFMQQNDFRPDLQGTQLIDVYTVGFTTSPLANSLLSSTAALGNGQFYFSTSAEQLAKDLVAAITDIIQKSQAFTAATVPATRTADQGNFYSSFFIPTGTNPFWEGHIRNFTLNGAGEIRDKNGNCAVNDPNPPSCDEGQILGTAVPHWDAADAMPAPDTRRLYMSLSNDVDPFLSARSTNAGELGVTFPPITAYPNSAASDAEGLADEIVEYVRGCEFGTGVTNTCVERTRPDTKPRTLGDIFHSDPVVVGVPSAAINEPSYGAFAQAHATRQRVLLAGANDGFFHGFNAGTHVGGGVYNRGDGSEIFGFMPWAARQNIRQIPIDTGNRSYYFVDGSPAVADVWMYPTDKAAALNINPLAKSASDWKTIVVGSMRQGGEQVFALDVTDPSLAPGSPSTDPPGYPKYLWEFPEEGETRSFDGTGTYTYDAYMGQSWSKPVIVRVKVTVPGDTNSGIYERWVAIFAGGYHPSGDPNDASYDNSNDANTSRKGRALFMMDVKTGRVLAAHFYHHDVGSATLGSSAGGNDEMRYAFASRPAVIDEDFDGYADIVYIGDLGGNLWKWVIKPIGVDSVNPIDGLGNDFTTNKLQSAWAFGKMLVAPTATISGTTYYKSFFFPPAVTYFGQDLWLAVGSGERANPGFAGADPLDASENNRFYAFKDPNKLGLPNMNPLRTPPGGPAHIIGDSPDLADLSNVTGCPGLSEIGYFFAVREGEKFVTDVDIIAFEVFAGSFTPNGSLSACDSGGDGTLYTFKVYCGEGDYPSNTGADQRRFELGAGMPTSSRLSIGDDGGDVFVMSSENKVKKKDTAVSGNRSGLFFWRER